VTDRGTRLLLGAGVSTEAVKQLAARHWFLWNRIERDDEQPLMYEWATNPDQCRIRYIDDHRLGLRWLDITGPNPEGVIAIVRKNLPIENQTSVVAACSSAKTEEEGIWAAYKLAITAAATHFDPELFGAFGDLSNHRSARVRQAAVYAMEQARWRELSGIAEPMAEDDPDEAVRARAAAFVKGLQ